MGESSGNLSRRDVQIHEIALLMADLEELDARPSDEHTAQRRDGLQRKIESAGLSQDELHVAQRAKDNELARREDEDKMKQVRNDIAKLEAASDPTNTDPNHPHYQDLAKLTDERLAAVTANQIQLINLAQRLKSGSDSTAEAEFEALKDVADIRFVERLLQKEEK